MQRSIVAMSASSDPETAFGEVVKKIQNECVSPKLIIFFSDCENFYFYTTKLHEVFPEATAIGTTTYLNFCTDGIGRNGFSAMAVNSGVECTSGILFEISNYPKHYIYHIYDAVKALSDTENTCCLEFSTAFSNGEELVLNTFEEALEGKNIPVFGGSSGTSAADYKTTYVSLNGVCYKNSCVFVFIKNLEGKIVYLRENLFKHTSKSFTVTDVDVENRMVYELDHKPAADVLANALGVSLDQLSTELISHPLGRILGEKTFITEPDKVMPDGSVSFFAQIFNHTKLVLLEQGDIQETWNDSVAKAKELMPENSFCVVVNCLLRTALFENENLIDAFSNILQSNFNNYIGLSGYGEQYNFTHMNQTMLLVLFE